MTNQDILHKVLHTLLPQIEDDINEYGFFSATAGWVKADLDLEVWKEPKNDWEDEKLVPIMRKETGQNVHLFGRVASWLCYSANPEDQEDECAIIEIKIVAEKFRYYYYYPFIIENEVMRWGTPWAEKVPV